MIVKSITEFLIITIQKLKDSIWRPLGCTVRAAETVDEREIEKERERNISFFAKGARDLKRIIKRIK